MGVGPYDKRLDPALEVASHVLQWLAATVSELRGQVQRTAAKFANRDFESRSGAQRRFFEKHSDVGASQGVRRRSLVRKAPFGFQLRRKVEQS